MHGTGVLFALLPLGHRPIEEIKKTIIHEETIVKQKYFDTKRISFDTKFNHRFNACHMMPFNMHC